MIKTTLNLCDGISPTMLYITSVHDHVLVILTLITFLVIAITSCVVLAGKYPCRVMKSSEPLELGWTLMPCVVLMSMASPSLMTLYMSEDEVDPSLTIKVTGHQWYWSYEYDLGGLSFDSYMITSAENEGLRGLEVDCPLVLPLLHNIRVIVTSSDVIHSWAVPSLGVKVDAVPGRLNQLSFSCMKVGKVYGQCSEICGTGHSFMPIQIDFLLESEFCKWVEQFK